MARKKTAAVPDETLVADAQSAKQQEAFANPDSAENQPTDPVPPPLPEPGHETAKRSWEPWSSISTPLTDEAKVDFQKGPVARNIEGYNSGVGVAIDHPDSAYRPSPHVIEPLKEDHKGHKRFSWRQALNRAKIWHKQVRENPIAERLDGESRYADTVERAREELNDETKRRG